MLWEQRFSYIITATAGATGGPGGIGVNASPGFLCSTAIGCDEADNDGFIIQGSYTFGGKTKVAASYGESNQDSQVGSATSQAFNEVEHEMWTIGVYHDVNSWLKVVAEYNDAEQDCSTALGARCAGADNQESDGFSVGGFIFFWLSRNIV